jgi:hypothetical protein
MATEPSARGSARPRTSLLVLLGVVVAVFLVSQIFSGGSGRPAVSTPTRPAGKPQPQPERIDPAELDVRIEALNQVPAGPLDGNRNPFRFQPKPQPAPPPLPRQSEPVMPDPAQPQEPQGPPPIGNLIKFIGIVDTGRERIGAFSDCRYTFSGREGEVIEGRFRVVQIGVESAVLEYTDGRGRTTLPLNGQACVGK